jgi:hypothetical protein
MRLDTRVAFARQVIVEPDQHLQFGQGVVADVDRPQRARRVGDDECVPGIGLRPARIEIRDAVHRQAGQIGHPVTGRAGDRGRQRPERGRLIDHDQQRSVPGELVEQGPEGSLLGSGPSCSRFPSGSSPTAWWVSLPTSRPRNTPKLLLIRHAVRSSRVATGLGIERRHPRYDETYQLVAVSLMGPVKRRVPGSGSCCGAWR